MNASHLHTFDGIGGDTASSVDDTLSALASSKLNNETAKKRAHIKNVAESKENEENDDTAADKARLKDASDEIDVPSVKVRKLSNLCISADPRI